MSMTKSFTGTLAEMLVAEGTLDDTLLVSDIIPELDRQRLRVRDGAAGHGHDDRLRVLRGLRRSERGDLGLQRRRQPLPEARRL
jgi:ABC-type transport system involved in cytochrome c biogenesis ATPase subunit